MSCNASDNTINPPLIPPPPGLPDFGLSPFAFPQIPFPTFTSPLPLIEDIPGLVAAITALFPSGKFVVNADFGMKNVLDFVANLFTQLAPYLSLYKFFMALLKMILCVIEVICAIPNPFALALKLEKLFTQCIPAFLALFPFLALILMIIALLLLILAIIEYIINTIIEIILLLIKNILKLVDAIQLQDAMAILAITQKIASLNCLMENIMAIMAAVAAIIAIIKALALIGGIAICSDGDPDGCCPPTICPAFIKTTPNGIPVSSARMIYLKEFGTDFTTIPGIPAALAKSLALLVPPVRSERWQIQDLSFIPQFPIGLIIAPSSVGNIFWPDNVTFTATSPARTSPYTVDIRIKVDPKLFGFTDDVKGLRYLQIKNCIVVREPYVGTMDYSNNIIFDNITGTLNIEGGLVYEDDGVTKLKNNDGKQATLNTLIHQASVPATSTPSSDDSITFTDITFTWKPNAAALAGHNLTTIGCIPSVNIEKAVQNSILISEGLDPVAVKLPFLPDVPAAQLCFSNAMATFRKDVSLEGAAKFQASAILCLNTLKDQVTTTLCNAIIIGTSQFKSTMALDTTVQFTSRPIIVSVILNDPGGNTLSNNIPATCVPIIEEKIIGTVTLGKISNFIYDGYTQFNAEITSHTAGTGELNVEFNNKIFNTIVLGTAGSTNTSIIENILSYQFIDASIDTHVRRDETDVANIEGS